MGKASLIYAIIKKTLEADSSLSVSICCNIACVSRSGFYAYLKAEPVRQRKEEQDRKDFMLILQAFLHRGYDKGVRGIHMYLLHLNPPILMNPKKISRLMKKYHLACPIRKPRPGAKALKEMLAANKAPNIVQRNFEAYGPRAILLTDITYLPYGEGQRAYLHTVMDAYTKEILAYTVSFNMEMDFVKETIRKLVEKHGDEIKDCAIIHSDQGAHFTSYTFKEITENAGLRRSMSRRGNCWDNAPQESFYGHMKDVIMKKLKVTKTYEEVVAEIDEYIDYYNNERYQWELAKLAPSEFYKFCMTGKYPIDLEGLPKNKNPKNRTEN